MTRFEYHVETFHQKALDRMNQSLAVHGENGWELVSVTPVAGGLEQRLFYKRPLTDKTRVAA